MPQLQVKATSVGITSRYGWRVLKVSGLRNFHKGYDTANGENYPHSAFADGIVTHSPQTKKDPEKGWYIQYGIPGVIEISQHSLEAPAYFKVGQRVHMGDIIGRAGKSALGASGRHVHNALWLGGVHVDPLTILRPGQAVTVSYGGNSIAAPVPAKPFDNSAARRRRANSMFDIYWTGPTPGKTHISGRMITAHGSFHVPNMQILGLLERRRNATWNAVADEMLDAEHDIINGYMRACFRAAMTDVAFDYAKFNVALTESFAKLGKDLVVDLTTGEKGNEIDAAELAAAVNLAVPRIVNAMIKQQGEALTAAASK